MEMELNSLEAVDELGVSTVSQHASNTNTDRRK